MRTDDMLAIDLRSSLPGHLARRIDSRLIEQRLRQVAVGAFESAHKRALFLPALPDNGVLALMAGAMIMGVKMVRQHRVHRRVHGRITWFTIVQTCHQGALDGSSTVNACSSTTNTHSSIANEMAACSFISLKFRRLVKDEWRLPRAHKASAA